MAGTVPISGKLTMENLAATLTTNEQDGFEQVTGLSIDTTQVRNLVTLIAVPDGAQLGPLQICGAGTKSQGTKILSALLYISGKKTKIDLYRLPLSTAS